jgi:hypothetical protein
MTEKVRAVFDGKVFYPEEPVELEINGHYLLKIEPAKKKEAIEKSKNAESDSAFDIASLAVVTGIADLSTEHDHYLYGTPKRDSNE